MASDFSEVSVCLTHNNKKLMSTITPDKSTHTSKAATSNTDNHVLCCYQNPSHQLQVVRISNIPNWYFERVVFPQQRLLFEAPSEAQLEIYTGGMVSAVLSDRITCERLYVDQSRIPTAC